MKHNALYIILENGSSLSNSTQIESIRGSEQKHFDISWDSDEHARMKFSIQKPLFPRTRSLISASSIDELQMKLGGPLDDYRITIGDKLFAIEHDLWEHLKETGGVHELVAIKQIGIN